jgi:hypothetical protein
MNKLKNIFNRIKRNLFPKKTRPLEPEPLDENWIDISRNLPNWLKEKISDMGKSLPNRILKNGSIIFQGRYSIYRVYFLDYHFSAVYRKRKQRSIPGWKQVRYY